MSYPYCLKTILFTAGHTSIAHSEVDFSPVFPNLPGASQKSITTVSNQAKPGSLYLLMRVKLVVVSSQSADIAINYKS